AGLNPAFSISDRDDAADLMHLVRHDLGLSNTGRRFPTKHTCLAIYSRAVNTMTPLETLLQRHYPWCVEWHDPLRALFRGYVAAKQAQDVLDYDDLLLYWARLAGHPEVARELDARFRHILVDEYQDTNRLQAAILLAIKPHGHGLTVVGDDAQSIYSFRGAEVSNILEFPTRFDPPATIVTLDRNYRSTQPILAAANAVISLAQRRYAKQLWSHREGAQRPALVDVRDEAAQAQYVAEQVLGSREAGVALRGQAVLFRASHHSAALEIELARRNLPFVKFGGLKFLDASHVKDVLGVLRFSQNPLNRVAGFRVLQLLPGVGPAAAQRVMEQLAAAQPWHELAAPARAVEGWSAWVELMAALATPTHGAGAWAATEVELVCRWYTPHLQRMHEDFATRAGDLSALTQIAATFASREAFLTELTLDPPHASSGEAGKPLLDEDYLILSTIHSAKGQEWQRVYILNGVDGCIPSDLATGAPEEIEEERRLLYVAMTRAKDQLDIIVPQRFYLTQQSGAGDRHVYAARTRFIPQRLDALFERGSWPPAVRSAVGSQALAAVKLDIAAQMRSMWD
ncbi:MAG: ATP-dependent helicase, partial [Janthinobacterium lividum]